MNDQKIDRYLFDPGAPPADEVTQLEEILMPLRHDPQWRSLAGTARSRSWSAARFPWTLAAAAMILVIAGAAAWVWTWPAQQSWKVVAGPMKTLPVGRPVQTGPAHSLLVRVARIGWMRIGERSVLTLLSTRSNRHHLSMASGTIRVSVWAPPGSVNIRTPSGDVIDLGCEFIVRAEASTTSVDVISGWVQLGNLRGEVLVPGGASSQMQRSGRPNVPLFRSASPQFQAAIRKLEDGSSIALPTAVSTSRRRDVLTLLVLATRDLVHRDALIVRAAELMPPHSGETLLQARSGNNNAIREWIDELPLPPRSWVRNWRDRLNLR